jgi:hypothetical protein
MQNIEEVYFDCNTGCWFQYVSSKALACLAWEMGEGWWLLLSSESGPRCHANSSLLSAVLNRRLYFYAP